MSSPIDHHGWTFLTNHSQVLLCLARDPEIRIRDVVDHVGITERAARRIVGDLVASGYVERMRVGRRNRYQVNREKTMRHAAQAGQDIGGLLDLLQPPPAEPRPAADVIRTQPPLSGSETPPQ